MVAVTILLGLGPRSAGPDPTRRCAAGAQPSKQPILAVLPLIFGLPYHPVYTTPIRMLPYFIIVYQCVKLIPTRRARAEGLESPARIPISESPPGMPPSRVPKARHSLVGFDHEVNPETWTMLLNGGYGNA